MMIDLFIMKNSILRREKNDLELIRFQQIDR